MLHGGTKPWASASSPLQHLGGPPLSTAPEHPFPRTGRANSPTQHAHLPATAQPASSTPKTCVSLLLKRRPPKRLFLCRKPSASEDCCAVLSCARLFETLWNVAYQAPLSMEFSRQEYWSRLPFPPPGDLTDPGIEPASRYIASRFFTTEPPGKSF